jgi:hypothetical protein
MASSATGDASPATPRRRLEQRALPERPLLTTPRHLHASAFLEAERDRMERQPLLGAAGLVFVVPLTALLAFGVGGAQNSLHVFAPIVLSAMPVVVMVVFWWEDWPGTRLRAAWTGWVDSLLIAACALVLTAFAQIVVGRFDFRGIVEPSAAPSHVPTFPSIMPVAGVAFVAMIEITLVSEGWPLRRLGGLVGGPVALVLSHAIAIAVYHGAHGFVSNGRLGTALVLIGLWQVWFFLLWRGWPFSALTQRWPRLALGNAIVLTGGISTYAVGRALDLAPATLNAAASCLIAAALLIAVLFEGVLSGRAARWERLLLSGCLLPVGALLYVGFRAYADRLNWGQAQPLQWVSHITLAIVAAILLHVAVGRRWPFFDQQAVKAT